MRNPHQDPGKKISVTALYPVVFLIIALLLSGCVTPEKWAQPRPVEPPPDPPAAVRLPSPSPGSGKEAAGPDIKTLPPADAPLTLTVEEAVFLALENNRDIRIQKLNPVIAGLFEKIEQGAYDPEVFAELALEKESDPDPEDEETAAILSAGVRRDLPWGTTLEASAALEDVRSGGTSPEDAMRLGLSVTQALLRGAGPAVNLAAIRASRLDTLSSQYELQGFIQALAGETEIAYWNYVMALKEHTIVENSLTVSKQQQAEVAEKIDVGILPENELAAASADVARQEQALISSKNQVEARRMNLLRFFHPGDTGHLGRPVEAVSSPVIPPVPSTGLSDRITLAFNSRPDLAEADLRLRRGTLDTIVTQNGILPRLDFFMDLGINGYANGIGNMIRALDGDAYDITAGMRLSRYLDNRAARARHAAALTTLDQAKLAIENLKIRIELEVRLAADEAETARRLIAAARTTREFQEETLRAELERFKAGTSTALLVTQARRDLLVSRIAEARAVINYRIALVRLFLAEGSLLRRRGLLAGGD